MRTVIASEQSERSNLYVHKDCFAPSGLAMTGMSWMPAEWEPHAATWLAWPKNASTWPGKLLPEVESVYLQMITALLPGERVKLLIADELTKKKILKSFPHAARLHNLEFHKVGYVDSWIRDWGPIFVKKPVIARRNEVTTKQSVCSIKIASAPAGPRNDGVTFTKWTFNAWGNKYVDLARDNGVVNRIAALKKFKRIDTGMVLEGGSIDMNGRGACLTTEQCLLNPNRNPKLSKKDIESMLRRFLGVEKVIWLKKGIAGDDTDGHVDDIARFVGPRTIVSLPEYADILKKATDQDGRKLEIWELPVTGAVDGETLLLEQGVPARFPSLPASYANFYIGNRVVLVPIYSHANDRAALKIIQKAFPKRKVIGIDCSSLVHGLGAIHCVTQQEPK